MSSTLSEKGSRSNYDRWKPGTKLACMMALKRICQDPNFFDTTSNKYNSLTWHTVAENLNKEYPDYAKRFTNINVKDRFDRVLKHHKVFVKMANHLSGFVWNPKTCCFEQSDELVKEYEKGIRQDEIIRSELNIARFLCKPGHIDLEYYHRYIYQIKNENELRNDTILNSPSYIEEAISKGILTNLSTRPSFFKDSSSGSHTGSTSTNISDLTNGGSNDSSLPLANSNHSPLDTQSSLPPPLSNNQLKQQKLKHTPIPPHQQIPPQPQPIQHPIMSPHTHQQPLPQQAGAQQQGQQLPSSQQPPQPPLPEHQLSQSNSNLMNMSVIHQPPNSLPPGNNDLDFSGLIDNQAGLMNTQISGLPMIPGVNQEDHAKNNVQQDHQHQHQPHQFLPSHHNQVNQPSQVQHHMNVHQQHPQAHQSQPHSNNHEPPRKKLKSSMSQSIAQPGLMVENYETYLNSPSPSFNQHLPGINTAFSPGSKAISSGEAVLQIHKEVEMMKNVVNEGILQLRMRKILSFEDFSALQHIQENNITFIRSAYKRVRDGEKLMELIAVYLNKI